MRIPQYYGSATAEFTAEDDGSRASIYIEVIDDGANGNWTPKTAHASISPEAAYKLAEEIDAAIDLVARQGRAVKEWRQARIENLKALLADLTAQDIRKS